MLKNKKLTTIYANTHLPVFVEKDEDGFYVAECPVFEGCYTQGKNIKGALKNIKGVIRMLLEEKENQDILASYHPREFSLHRVAL